MYCIGFYNNYDYDNNNSKRICSIKGIRQGRGTAFETIISFYAWSLLSI